MPQRAADEDTQETTPARRCDARREHNWWRRVGIIAIAALSDGSVCPRVGTRRADLRLRLSCSSDCNGVQAGYGRRAFCEDGKPFRGLERPCGVAQLLHRLATWLTPSFFCRLVDDVVYWNTSRLSG